MLLNPAHCAQPRVADSPAGLRMTKWEMAAPAGTETPAIKLFGKWSTDDGQINDISLQDNIEVKEQCARYLPCSAGHRAPLWSTSPTQG